MPRSGTIAFLLLEGSRASVGFTLIAILDDLAEVVEDKAEMSAPSRPPASQWVESRL